LFKFDRKQVADRTLNRRLINYYPAGFLSICKRIIWNEFSGRQFDISLRVQKKKQTSADHVFEDTVGLSPIPILTDFLGNKTSAFARMGFNDLLDCLYILQGDRSPPICKDWLHS
jgi:hypothetical protein